VGGLIVTGHNEEKSEEISPEAQRKREQRERDAEAGIVEFEVRLGPLEAAMLREGQEIRGGAHGAYTRAEYIATLIRRDNALLQQQRGALEGRVCENCRKPLPRGCGGTWGRESLCEFAQADRALKL
jgi:hypothetical protein